MKELERRLYSLIKFEYYVFSERYALNVINHKFVRHIFALLSYLSPTPDLHFPIHLNYTLEQFRTAPSLPGHRPLTPPSQSTILNENYAKSRLFSTFKGY